MHFCSNLFLKLRYNFKFTFIFIIISLRFNSMGFATTLKEMAQTSNFILTLSDQILLHKKTGASVCNLEFSNISEVSQNLKSEIQAKIDGLDNYDLAIITKRLKTCKLDCTCDIYLLALETKITETKKSEIENKESEKSREQNSGLKTETVTPDMIKKMSEINEKDRILCSKKNPVGCSSRFFKKLLGK